MIFSSTYKRYKSVNKIIQLLLLQIILCSAPILNDNTCCVSDGHTIDSSSKNRDNSVEQTPKKVLRLSLSKKRHVCDPPADAN